APRIRHGWGDRVVPLQGDLLVPGLMNPLLDCITGGGGSFEIETFQAGLRHDQASLARVRVVAPSPERLGAILTRLVQLGARVAEEDRDARLEAVTQPGVAPRDFYSTTIYPTEVRVGSQGVRVARPRMDAAAVGDGLPPAPPASCRLLRDRAVAPR